MTVINLGGSLLSDAAPGVAATDVATVGQLPEVTVAPSGDATGVTDPGDLNAAIAAVSAQGGGTVRGLPTGPWYLGSPFILKSGVTLDMTGCVITEVAGSNCNMITNESAVATPVSGTGNMTVSTNTINTSLGASAVIGQSVYVAGAGSGGDVLCGIVGAQTSSTITVIDMLGNDLYAAMGVTGATVDLYNRDSGITVKGGTWNRGANGFPSMGALPTQMTTCFRRVDGLDVGGGLTVTCTARGYNVHYGDCRNFRFHDITVQAPVGTPNTDGVHGWGPLAFGSVENIYGTNGDDFVILDNRDPGVTIDVCGSISDVSIRNLFPGGGAPNGGGGAILVGSGTFTISRVSIDGVFGSSFTYAVGMGSGATGCLIDDVFVSNVSNAATRNSVGLEVTGGGNITLRNIAWAGNSATPGGASMISVEQFADIGALTVDGISLEVSGVVGLAINAGAAVGTVIVKNVNAAAVAAGEIVQVNGAVTVLSVDGMHVTTTGTLPGIYVGAIPMMTPGSVGQLHLADVYYSGSGSVLFSSDPTATVGQVLINGCTLDGAGYLADGLSAIDFIINGLNVPGIASSQLIYVSGAGAAISVRGAGWDNPTSVPLFTLAGGMNTPPAPRVVCAEALCDLSGLSRANNGDIAFNANGSLSCGTGVAISDGGGGAGSWKNLFSGLTY